MHNSSILTWPTGSLDFSNGTLAMGILNVTPDSFSDGGQYTNHNIAISHGLELAAAGAAIIDIGPESTRPGAAPVPADEQIKRAIPVIEQLSKQTKAVISIDVRSVEVAAAAIDAGASMINDITALSDNSMAKLAADRNVPVILMHMSGTPETMQNNPTYTNVTEEVISFLLERAEKAQLFGIAKEMIFIDPGIGFGKTLEHNLQLLRDMPKFIETGYKLLIGTSRKHFIGSLTDKETPSDRIFGTAATIALSAAAGAAIVRVHDIPEMLDVLKVANAIKLS